MLGKAAASCRLCHAPPGVHHPLPFQCGVYVDVTKPFFCFLKFFNYFSEGEEQELSHGAECQGQGVSPSSKGR